MLLSPVMHGLCKYESLIDGTLDLGDVMLMNIALSVKFENERRAQKEASRGNNN